MNIVCKCALVGASLVIAYACANPVDINGDVLIADPNDFGDGGIVPGAGGTAGSGGGLPTGGTGAGIGGANTGTGGTGAGVGGTGAGVGGAVSGVGGTASGTGGTGAGVGGTGAGTGGTGTSGAGGTGTGGTGAGTGGTGAGTGGTGSQAVFDPQSCNFTNVTGCEDLACDQACPTNDGGSCLSRCTPVIDCVTDNSACITEGDPLCGDRVQGQPKECTTVVEPAGGFNSTNANQPSFVARQFVECICSTPRP
jgi:hypothetical protein